VFSSISTSRKETPRLILERRWKFGRGKGGRTESREIEGETRDLEGLGLTECFYRYRRKCSATNRIIKANDHASVQISVCKVDETGRAIPGESISYALCGFVRSMGESDDSLNRLAQKDGLLKAVWSANRS